MKARYVLVAAVVVSAFAFAARPAAAQGPVVYEGSGGWCDQYYDPAWGMPLAVVVPPNARWQTDYSWGIGGLRVQRVGARYQWQYPGPESSYVRGQYLPAPSQPSDTRQLGDYYVRGPRR